MKTPENIDKPTKEDLKYRTIRGGLSAFPIAGGPLVEIFTSIWEEPIQKRRIKWIQDLSKGLSDLEIKFESFSTSKLKDNDEFISILLTASQIAQRNHQKEKLIALKNAVLNTARKIDIEEDVKLLFLSFLENLTKTEIRIIHF